MTKSELIEAVHGNESLGMSKREVELLVGSLFDSLREAIAAGGRFTYPGFGTFTVRSRKARTGRNPRNGKEIKIAASKTIAFKAAPKFKAGL